MSDITVTFKDQTILTMDASGSKPLLTQGKYCEDDITIAYVKPSGGSSNVLLASFVAAQDTATIQISGDFSGYSLYMLELVGSTNTTEWIYPEFNGVTNTSNYFAPRGGATNWDTVIPLLYGTANGIPQFMNSNSLACPTYGASGSNVRILDIGGALSSIVLHLYNAQNVFATGFKAKLWGVPLSTT